MVKVYGHMGGLSKLASKICSPGTTLKFDEPARDLANLAKQVGYSNTPLSQYATEPIHQ